MLLLEIEKQAKTLSTPDKARLIRAVQQWLKEETEPQPDMYPAVDVPDITGDYVDWKLHPDFNWNEMHEAAEKLQLVKSAMTGPTRLDEDALIFVDGSDA